MRITGGKMIMLDMMPTLISCKREGLPNRRQETCLPREVEHQGQAEVGVGEVALHLAVPANLTSRWWSDVCASSYHMALVSIAR